MQENTDWLEQVLREEHEHIDDAGFTGRMMAALPPHTATATRRTWIIFGMTLVACVTGLWLLPGANFVSASIVEILSIQSFAQDQRKLINLGSNVNSTEIDISPVISADGKSLSHSSARRT